MTDWFEKADQNIEEWGDQDLETLLLCMQEELGELTQAVLQYQHEEGEAERIREELDDLMPLGIQFERKLESIQGGEQ
ncbi:hypothetical protein C437_01715 [Haloarcula vallismortis ATCC 29715]|uniref:Uncharacterized protein n=1 Tax=Haloarcula vallismortis ATCC 29715 TaxID=662477 RepID=M0JUF2_HALVA|nr:hypothetical protein [Haloarcula vallismortis]EMA11589.1 hypothetical protein C437_01715 [Haloarcula vallismortis ATCC 29715]